MTEQPEGRVPDEERERKHQMELLREKGIDPFGSRYDRSHYTSKVKDNFTELEGKTVKVAGRISAKRDLGKVNFIDINDTGGKIQLYLKIDNIGRESFDLLNLIFLGDFLGAEGKVFRTKRGEISIQVEKYQILGKALKPLPEKYHGLKDKELRYRNRYLDMIANPDVKEVFLKRTSIIKHMRNYLDENGFVEVQTPSLHKIPGGAFARPFGTHLNAMDMDLFLRISLELHLKMLMIGGIERVYEIGQVFRNEGMDRDHNPEFTMLEVYEAFGDLESMKRLTEGVILHCAQEANGSLKCDFRDLEIDLSPPWREIDFNVGMKQRAGVDLESDITTDALVKRAKELAYLETEEETPKLTRGQVIDLIFKNAVEPHLIQPTFVVDYPIEISPLAKRHPDKVNFVQRFELFIAGHELANAFTELNDPIDQRERFEEQARLKIAGDEEAHPMDEEFLRAVEHGMPPAGGMGMGVDRLVMLLTGQHSIRDVIFFPMMR